MNDYYLVDDSAFGASYCLQPSFPQWSGFLGYAVKVSVVMVTAIARAKLAVGKSTRSRHSSLTIRIVRPITRSDHHSQICSTFKLSFQSNWKRASYATQQTQRTQQKTIDIALFMSFGRCVVCAPFLRRSCMRHRITQQLKFVVGFCCSIL